MQLETRTNNNNNNHNAVSHFGCYPLSLPLSLSVNSLYHDQHRIFVIRVAFVFVFREFLRFRRHKRCVCALFARSLVSLAFTVWSTWHAGKIQWRDNGTMRTVFA